MEPRAKIYITDSVPGTYVCRYNVIIQNVKSICSHAKTSRKQTFSFLLKSFQMSGTLYRKISIYYLNSSLM